MFLRFKYTYGAVLNYYFHMTNISAWWLILTWWSIILKWFDHLLHVLHWTPVKI